MSLMKARLALTGIDLVRPYPYGVQPSKDRSLSSLVSATQSVWTAVAFRRMSARSESMRRTSLRYSTARPAVMPLIARATSKQCLTCMSTLTARLLRVGFLGGVGCNHVVGVVDALFDGPCFACCSSSSPHFNGTCFDERVAPTPAHCGQLHVV